MTDTIQFFVDGDPKPQPRPRAFSINGTARVYDPHTAEGWKSAIADAARPHCPPEPWRGPVCITLTFRFRRPKSHYRSGKHQDQIKPNAPIYHTGRPDSDNIAKAALDALTLLGFWKDDAQVCELNISKTYDRLPGLLISATLESDSGPVHQLQGAMDGGRTRSE